MADDDQQLTPELWEVYAGIVRRMRDSYGGLPLEIEPPENGIELEGNRAFNCTFGDWTIRGIAEHSRHRTRLMSLTISPTAPGAEVTAGLVKEIPVGAIAASLTSLLTFERAEQALEGQRDPLFARAFLEEYAEALHGAEAKTQRPSRGRAPLGDDLLRAVAQAYLDETAPGMPRKAMERMARRFDKPEETVRTWVSRARKDGWLGPAVKGRVGAEPGPRLLADPASSRLTGRSFNQPGMGGRPRPDTLKEQGDGG